MPVFFQAIGNGRVSVLLSLTRQIFCLLPIFWAFSLIGLDYTWLSFPISETIAGALGLLLYYKQTKVWS
jgi:Na+-driven multidrug efflux pump